MTEWFAVVTFGSAAWRATPGKVHRTAADAYAAIGRADRRDGGYGRVTADSRVVRCATRAQARSADISDNLPTTRGGLDS